MVLRLRISVTIFTTSVALLLATVICYPGGISAAYRDLRDYSDLQARMDDQRQTQQELHHKTLLLQRRIQIKDVLIEDLIQGRTTLISVAKQFQVLNSELPEGLYVLHTLHPDVSELERSALNVMEYVELRELPQKIKAKVFARLRTEFRQAFGHRYQTVY